MNIRRLLVLRRKDYQEEFSHTFHIHEGQTLQNARYCKLDETLSDFIDVFKYHHQTQPEHRIKYDAGKDSCRQTHWDPVKKLKVKQSEVWPVVFLDDKEFIYVAVPLVTLDQQNVPFSEIPEMPATIEFLDVFRKFHGGLKPELSDGTVDLESILNLIAPFGTLINCSLSNFKLAVNGSYNLSQSTQDFLQPANSKSNLLTLRIDECLRGVFLNKSRTPDKFECSGKVTVHSQLPVVTDIAAILRTTLNLSNVTLTSSCVHTTSSDNEIQIFATPGNDPTTIMRYNIDILKPPLSATYNVKPVDHGLFFTITLKFRPEVKIQYDIFEVSFPFPNRGPITSVTHDPDRADVSIVKDNSVLWRKPRVVSDVATLSGRVIFDNRKRQITDNPGLVNLNCYADITFTTVSTTFSQVRLDQSSVKVFPATRVKLNYATSAVGKNIRVWNASGDVVC